jgi:PAS domain S-box-containing protein
MLNAAGSIVAPRLGGHRPWSADLPDTELAQLSTDALPEVKAGQAEAMTAAFHSAQEGLYLIDPHTLAYVDVNEAGAKLVGRSRQELLAGGPKLLGADEVALRRKYADLIAGYPVSETEERSYMGRSGEAVLLETTRRAIRMQGGWLILSIARDIGELKQMQARAELLAAAINRNSDANTRFLAAVSHDLRQPLHAIGLFIDTLKGESLPHKAQELVGNMQGALQSAQSLLDAVLLVSRLDSRMIAPNLMPFELEGTLQGIRTVFGPAARRRGLRLTVGSSAAIVHSDPGLLERIVAALVSNALRFTRRGGVVVACRPRGRFVQIEVWDTGQGIAPELQRSVFEEFFRTAGQDGSSGAGLGLAIAQRAARLLGYSLELRSVPGRGSRFHLRVPLSEQPVEATVASPLEMPEDGDASAAARLAGTVVVLVDDDPIVLERTQALLERWGLLVVAAGSGPQAEALIAHRGATPALVICDLWLSGGETGVEVIQRLRSTIRPDLPAILLTGDTSLMTARATRSSGATLLYKPVPAGRLLAAIAHRLPP